MSKRALMRRLSRALKEDGAGEVDGKEVTQNNHFQISLQEKTSDRSRRLELYI